MSTPINHQPDDHHSELQFIKKAQAASEKCEDIETNVADGRERLAQARQQLLFYYIRYHSPVSMTIADRIKLGELLLAAIADFDQAYNEAILDARTMACYDKFLSTLLHMKAAHPHTWIPKSSLKFKPASAARRQPAHMKPVGELGENDGTQPVGGMLHLGHDHLLFEYGHLSKRSCKLSGVGFHVIELLARKGSCKDSGGMLHLVSRAELMRELGQLEEEEINTNGMNNRVRKIRIWLVSNGLPRDLLQSGLCKGEFVYRLRLTSAQVRKNGTGR